MEPVGGLKKRTKDDDEDMEGGGFEGTRNFFVKWRFFVVVVEKNKKI